MISWFLKNNGTHKENDIIMDNEDYPENNNIHEDTNDNTQLDTQLDTTNEQLYPSPLPDSEVEADNIRRSTRVHTNPKRLIPLLNNRKSYDINAATTILEQDYADLVGTDDNL